MNATAIRVARWAALALAVLGSCPSAFSQDWTALASFQAGPFPAGCKVKMAMEGDVLVLAVSHEAGGTIEVHQRHQGGFEQWGVLGSEQSTVPWFGNAVALSAGRLAVGSPGAQGAGSFTGEVRLYTLNDTPGEEALELQQMITLPDQLSGDRFGYDVLWLGDTLAVSAVSRASARSSGNVFLFVPVAGDYSATPPSSLPPLGGVVPFTRWFGASMASSGGRLAVAAPFTGFEPTIAQQDLGSIHLFRREPDAPSGWASDTSWSDLALDGSTTCAFERMELGRWGMAFVNGGLMLDHSFRYAGPPGSTLDPWIVPDTTLGECPTCGLRVVDLDQELWDFSGSSAPLGTGAPFFRGASSWCAANDTLLYGRYDPGTGQWATVVHLRNAGGEQAWGPSLVLPMTDACDRSSGPMLLAGPFFVRVSLRTGVECSVPEGAVRLVVDVFEP